MTPDNDDLWFLPLGGTGEIGMNFNLYGHAGKWLAVDCGVTFPRPGSPAGEDGGGQGGGPPIQMADPAFIAERREQLVGMVITHAHEDHIGAVPYLWSMLKCPVYTTRFTAEVLRRKLAEFGLTQVPVIVVDSDDRRVIGPFDVEWLPITHSIPDPGALMIRTAVGNIFHSGDWKLDPEPLIGHGYRPETFQRLGAEGVAAMVCDSTNATVAGHSVSEAKLRAGLEAAVDSCSGRVIVACFGSNIARLHTLAAVARSTGRYMGLLGRSLINMSQAASASGLWDANDHLVNASHLGYLPRHEVLAVATGSQGEPRAALRRLAAGNHPDFELESGDRVIFSARAIPGNEIAIAALIAQLKSNGVEVMTAESSRLAIHASGHPAADELKAMYEWVKPELAIPVHGEDEHMRANARLARSSGVPKTLTGRNGDLFMIRPVVGIRRSLVATGRLGYDGRNLSTIR